MSHTQITSLLLGFYSNFLTSILVSISFCFGHCIYVHSLSKTNLQLGGHSFLVLSKASGKGKIRGRCRFPGSKKKEDERLVVRSRRSDGGDGWSQVTLRPSRFLF